MEQCFEKILRVYPEIQTLGLLEKLLLFEPAKLGANCPRNNGDVMGNFNYVTFEDLWYVFCYNGKY